MESKLNFELFIKLSCHLLVPLRTFTLKASNRADVEVKLREVVLGI